MQQAPSNGRTIPAEYLAYYARQRLLSFACLMWDGYEVGAHTRLIAQKLEAVERGEIKRLLISMPPRHGKTMLCSEFFPAWFLGRNPDKMIIATTYNKELAEENGRKVRDIVADPYYSQIFPESPIDKRSSAVTRFGVGRRGIYFGTGVGGGANGRGAHIFLVDDPYKSREDADSALMRKKIKNWYTSVAYTRLMPGGAIIIIHTRWHVDDLIGWVEEEHAHEGWDVLSLPAITGKKGREVALWPEKYSVKALARIKKTLPLRDWEALYQQKPVIDGGNILKKPWWKLWDYKEPSFDYVLQSWDTAYSTADHQNSSYSAMTTWGVTTHPQTSMPCLVMIDAWKGRVDYPQLKREALGRYNERNPDCVVIEKKASGQSLIQDMRRKGIPIIEYQPDRDKVSRAYAVQDMLESGQIYYPDRRWAEEVIQECAEFPNGANNDYVDTCTQAWLRVRNAGILIPPEPEPFDDEDDFDDDFWKQRRHNNKVLTQGGVYG